MSGDAAARRGCAAARWRALGLGVALLLVALPARAFAQRGGDVRGVRGRVVRPVEGGERGVGGVMVTLHRVGPDSAGPIDSLRTAGDGRYEFRYRPTGSDQALYFVSASYGGIAYFGTPLRGATVDDEDAVVTVFDTTSRPIPLRVNGRHLIVSSSDVSERRELVEVFELSNDSALTRIAGGRDSATFRVPLPDGVQNFQGGEGDVSPEAIALVDGRAEVYAPLAPGVKQLSFSYSLARDAFPLALSVSAPTEVLEVLLEDSTGTVEGAGLVRQGPVSSSGRTFVRWVAENVPANAIVRVSFPASGSGRPPIPQYVVVAAGVAAVMLFAIRTVARRRVPSGASVASDEEPERLARRIAALDAAFERRRAPTDEERAEYRAERERLKGELTDVLARRDARR